MLVENLREGVGLVGLEDGVIRYCNKSYASILRLTPCELVGKSLFDFVDEKHADDAWRRKVLRLEDVGSAYVFSVIAADGSRKDLSATGSLVFGHDGSCRLMAHTIVDVTESKRAKEALRESEGRYRVAFDRAPISMAHVTPSGRFLRVNDRFCQLSGYGREELLQGMTWQDITPPEDLPSILERIRRALEGRLDAYSAERRSIRKDGLRVWIELSVSLVQTPSEEPDYFVCAANDVTERKLKELVLDPLTARELEVLRRVVAGWNNPRIAEQLPYSLGTIKLDVRRLIAKLEVDDRKQAAARAVEIGLVPPPRS